jgi:excisionase family DNA binding protein
MKSKEPEPDVNEEQILTPDEAAIKLKVTAEQVRSLIRRGQISAFNVGTGKKRPLYRITQRALNDFLNRRWQPGRVRQNKKFKRLDPVRDYFPDLK